MKTLVNSKRWQALQLGGMTFDKRTWAGKELVHRVKTLPFSISVDGIHPGLVHLRIRDLNDFFDFDLRSN